MLRLSKAFFNRSILSLRTGSKIGSAIDPLINPDNLKIEGWFAVSKTVKGEQILPAGEVREFITKGLVVNDFDAITDPKDLIRLKDIIRIRFDLMGKTVVTESKRRLGKVVDFAVDEGFYVQKLYVNPPIYKNLAGEQLLISREEIIEITNKHIVVADATIKTRAGVPLRAQV